jgi:hypothetical protein
MRITVAGQGRGWARRGGQSRAQLRTVYKPVHKRFFVEVELEVLESVFVDFLHFREKKNDAKDLFVYFFLLHTLV